MSYVPLVAPSTTDARIQFLASIADSFIYVVSKMGVTGSSASVSSSLSSLLTRIRHLLPSKIPLAVGFGVSTREHFQEVGQEADGVVIGSQIVAVIKQADKDGVDSIKAVGDYCHQVSSDFVRSAAVEGQSIPVESSSTPAVTANEAPLKTLPNRFGSFGGAYVPEALHDALSQLASSYEAACADPEFWKSWEAEFGYMNRPSGLYEAERLTKLAGGAKIWFKREDLNHTGSHKVRWDKD
jgi:tryptophan synthase